MSGLVTESLPPKSELHSDLRSSVLLGISSEVALMPLKKQNKTTGEKLNSKTTITILKMYEIWRNLSALKFYIYVLYTLIISYYILHHYSIASTCRPRLIQHNQNLVLLTYSSSGYLRIQSYRGTISPVLQQALQNYHDLSKDLKCHKVILFPRS